MKKNASPRSSFQAFTLVELLVVIAIISLLISMLMPSVHHAMGGAKSIQCLAQLREIGQAGLTYSFDHEGYMPTTSSSQWHVQPRPPDTGSWVDWMAHLLQAGALDDRNIFVCPSDRHVRADDVLGVETRYSYGINETVAHPSFTVYVPIEDIDAKRSRVMPLFGDCTVAVCTGWPPSGHPPFTFRARLANAGGPLDYHPRWEEQTLRHPDGSNVFFADGHADTVSWDRAIYGHNDGSFLYTPMPKPMGWW
jgi:prepilin-type N-terminal cleavage/methylation domain-containing protein/prepilin-type processing-associated H-X9-DG protein